MCTHRSRADAILPIRLANGCDGASTKWWKRNPMARLTATSARSETPSSTQPRAPESTRAHPSTLCPGAKSLEVHGDQGSEEEHRPVAQRIDMCSLADDCEGSRAAVAQRSPRSGRRKRARFRSQPTPARGVSRRETTTASRRTTRTTLGRETAVRSGSCGAERRQVRRRSKFV